MKTRILVVLLGWICMAGAAIAADMNYSSKVELRVNGRAKTDGNVTITFHKEGGASEEYKVPIVDGTGENSVAKAIERTLKVGLGTDYHVKEHDGEKIKIKTKGGADFALTVASNIEGVTVEIR